MTRLFDGSAGLTQIAGSSAASPPALTGSVSTTAVTSRIAVAGSLAPTTGEAVRRMRDKLMTRTFVPEITGTLLTIESFAPSGLMPETGRALPHSTNAGGRTDLIG